MKKKPGFWMAVGIIIAAMVSISSDSIPAGAFIGTGFAMLLFVVTNLEVDRKPRS